MKKEPQSISELENIRAELTALEAEFQDFAYIVSHDISGPLRHASGFAEMILSNNQATLNEKAVRHLNHIITSAEAGRKTLEALRAYSRVNTKPQIMQDDVDAADLVKAAMQELSGQIADKEASISFEALPKIFCDPARITLVFKNLMENGLTYQSDEKTPQINIKGWSEGDYWVFTVQDNGIGIPQSRTDDVFKVFRRAVEKADFPGEGMGLPYAKKIIEKHKGRLWLEATSEQGSLFSFSLPKTMTAK